MLVSKLKPVYDITVSREISRVVFFFQAEDGIRDHCVTGVQTCALPISLLIGILFLNILCSIGTLCSLSTNFAVSIQQQDFLDMGTVVIPSMLVYLLYMSFSIFLIVFRMLFIVFLGLLFAAFLARMTQAILATFVSIEVDDRTRIPIQTGGALLITSIVTCFAHVVQTICISSVYPEISSSCGKFLETYRARFRWYTIHGKGPSLSSWRMYQHHSSTTIFMGLL